MAGSQGTVEAVLQGSLSEIGKQPEAMGGLPAGEAPVRGEYPVFVHKRV